MATCTDTELGSGFLHSIQRTQVAKRLILMWSFEEGGQAPLLKGNGGHQAGGALAPADQEEIKELTGTEPPGRGPVS